MNENKMKADRVKAETVISNFEKRNISAQFCETREEALKAALSYIKDGDKVAWGGSVTLDEIGLRDAVRKDADSGRIELIDGYAKPTPEEQVAEKARALTSDVFYMSANAVTMNGELVNIDGHGNRVAALCFGPKKVVVVAGMNKIAADEESAVKRIKTYACPANCIRLNIKSPCAATGRCADCTILGKTICSMKVVTRFSSLGRIHVILVGEDLGY